MHSEVCVEWYTHPDERRRETTNKTLGAGGAPDLTCTAERALVLPLGWLDGIRLLQDERCSR